MFIIVDFILQVVNYCFPIRSRMSPWQYTL